MIRRFVPPRLRERIAFKKSHMRRECFDVMERCPGLIAICGNEWAEAIDGKWGRIHREINCDPKSNYCIEIIWGNDRTKYENLTFQKVVALALAFAPVNEWYLK